jgi:triosephosphate isomerase
MRDFLIAGNWKMNGSNATNDVLVSSIVNGIPNGEGFKLLVCPPFPYLTSIASQVSNSAISLGAQNVSEHESGAFTGETAAAMLKELGCEYVIVGHSERRAIFGETSEKVAAKYIAAQKAGITPILCVGETLEEREAGATEEVVIGQLDAILDAAGVDSFASAVIAYEPVWAIGTGVTATPEQAQDVHRRIRMRLVEHNSDLADSIQILYGGSMKGENASGLLAMPDIDGGLIGGASLKADDFLAIAAAAAVAGQKS